MKTYVTTWLLSGLCALLVMNCNRDEDNIIVEPAPQYVHVRYVQTQCADSWGQAQGSQALIAAAQTYLNQRNLTLHQPLTTNGTPSACAACTCPTGLVLEGDVLPADLSAVLAFGFKQ